MQLFKGNKWQQWWDSLPENYKTYLESQGQHYEQTDYVSLFVVGLFGFMIGIATGIWIAIK